MLGKPLWANEGNETWGGRTYHVKERTYGIGKLTAKQLADTLAEHNLDDIPLTLIADDTSAARETFADNLIVTTYDGNPLCVSIGHIPEYDIHQPPYTVSVSMQDDFVNDKLDEYDYAEAASLICQTDELDAFRKHTERILAEKISNTLQGQLLNAALKEAIDTFHGGKLAAAITEE